MPWGGAYKQTPNVVAPAQNGRGYGSAYKNAPTVAIVSGGDTGGSGKHRGFLGSVGHFIADKTERAARDIKGVPIGIAQTVEAPILDTAAGLKFIATGKGNAEKQAGKHSTAVAKAFGETSKTAVEHPLRDPFLTATTLLPFANTVARGGEIAAGADITAPRVLRAGGKQTALIRSRGATGRVVQRGYDKVVQKALDKNEAGQATGRVSSRVAAHAQKRIGGALDEESRIAQKMRATPAQLLDQAALKLSKLRGRRVQQAALELTSVQTTPEEAIAYHEAQAAKGVSPKQNLAVANLYRRVSKADLVHLDETRPDGAKVFINPAHEHLARVDEALAKVQKEGDQALVERGVRPEEALATRRNAPGRVRAGARMETQREATAARGVRSKRAHVAQVREYPARSRTVERAMTEHEAQSRLTALDQQYDQLVHKLIPETSPFANRQAEQLRRNFENSRAGRGKRVGARTQRTVTADEYRIAEDKLHEIAQSHHGNATADRVRTLIIERDKLRNALNERSGIGEGEPSALPSVTETIPGKPRRVRLREQAAVKRVRATPQFVGGETARPGRGYVSERVSEKKLSTAERGNKRGPVVGVTKSPIDSKTYTGRALAQGLRPKDVTGSASRHFRQIMRFQNTEDRVHAAVETGSDVRRSSRDILVRVDKNAKPIGPEIAQALGKETPAVDSAEELATAEGLRAAHQILVDRILGRGDPAADASRYSIGMKAPEGYKWVDQGALGDILKPPPGPRGRLARSVDTVNSAITAATVYFKVGHIGTRVFTNAATNIIQGSSAPRQLAASAELWNALTNEERAKALGAAGQHGFSALPHEGTNLVAHIASKGAAWWARNADAPFRFNSLAYELRKVGYGDPAKFKQALGALENRGQGLPANEWAKVSAAARRADREAISYDRLNEFEKRYITRAVWFYPWIKGSAIFTVRTAIEHPYKASVLGAAGGYGHAKQERTLGDTPSYEAGLMALTGGGNPLTTDFSTFSPFATGADVLDAVVQPGGAAGFLNPVAGAAGQFAYGLNQYGGASQSPYLDALRAVAAATPEQQLAESYAAAHTDQSGRMFPKTVGGTALRYLLGPATPRRVNRNALAKAAARERSGQR